MTAPAGTSELVRELRAVAVVLDDLRATTDPAEALRLVDCLDARAARMALLRAWLDEHPEAAAAAGWEPGS